MGVIDMTGWIMKEHNIPSSELTVLERDYEAEKRAKHRRAIWKCQCSCGNIISIRGESIRNGHTRSCGCLQKKAASQISHARAEDLTGKRFGKLTALYYVGQIDQRPKGTYWHCKCDCGKETDVTTQALRANNTRSCGCWVKERTYEARMIDLTGTHQPHGKLLALEPTDKRRNAKIMWKCKCDCGNYTEVASSDFINEHIQSCGCTKSYGESYIAKILQKNNIRYLQNSTFFTDLLLPSGGIGKYDFIIFNNNIPTRIIEFDGIQHFEENKFFERTLAEQKIADNIKNQYALSHNIPLVRIPYWERDNITLEMLLGDQYLIKENN